MPSTVCHYHRWLRGAKSFYRPRTFGIVANRIAHFLTIKMIINLLNCYWWYKETLKQSLLVILFVSFSVLRLLFWLMKSYRNYGVLLPLLFRFATPTCDNNDDIDNSQFYRPLRYWYRKSNFYQLLKRIVGEMLSKGWCENMNI